MPDSNIRDELLHRLLTPRIGRYDPSAKRRIYDFVARAARAHRQDELGLLQQMVAGGAPELVEALINSATVGHTAFFRHPAQFDHLRALLPSLAGSRGRTLELWCAGCSTGEEAYSLALCAEGAGVRARILATDVNLIALQTAREGHYTARSRTRLPGNGTEWTAPRELKKLVRFEQASLSGADPTLGGGPFDLVFCRNVLIYFDRNDVVALLARVASHVSPGGAIVVSPADAVLPLPSSLQRGSVPGWLEVRSTELGTAELPRAVHEPLLARRLTSVGAPPVQAESPIERAARLLGCGARDEAEHVISKLLNQDSEDVVAWFLLGEALLQRGERVQARLAFQRASRAQPRELELGGIDSQAVCWAAGLRAKALESDE